MENDCLNFRQHVKFIKNINCTHRNAILPKKLNLGASMKNILSISLLTLCLTTTAQAKSFFGTVDKYINIHTNQIIEVASNEIEDGVASYFDYSDNKRKTINISELSKATREEISDVRAGEAILAKTFVANSKEETVIRFCQVFYLFENKSAYVGCKTTEKDNIPGYQTPARFDFIISNIESVTPQVSSLDGFETKETCELKVETKTIEAGKRVKILAIFANGEALIQKVGLNFLDTSGILNKLGSVERVKLSDLNKI